jgi:RNA polymerase sigma-70 factor, ECF subfamily
VGKEQPRTAGDDDLEEFLEFEGFLQFEEFFQKAYPEIVRLMFLVSSSKEDAEDIAQEAMVRLLTRWTRVRGMENPMGYLYKVALNLNRRRLRRLAKDLPGRPFRADSNASNVEGVATTVVEVQQVLRSLPAHHREVLILSDWLMLDTASVARLQGVSKGTARVRLHRARETFKRRFSQ